MTRRVKIFGLEAKIFGKKALRTKDLFESESTMPSAKPTSLSLLRTPPPFNPQRAFEFVSVKTCQA